ncbi:MAG: beta-xylosidase [Planctomycetes bacterium]|nr:beta-xylosidase [Planctomycetota bacterium]
MHALLLWAATLAGAADDVRIAVDATARGSSLRQVWSYFGYDECNLTTTPAARDLMRTLARTQPEPVTLRQHFLLATGDGTPDLKWGSTNAYTEDAAGNPVYDWTILDGILDAVVESGCRPLIEIGFMPEALSAKPAPYRLPTFGKIGGGVSQPPKDYAKWADLIRAWARHSADRYPGVEATWWWELWNEPNIGYWQGTFEEYCELFDHTERALHEVLPGAVLGGPHTVGARLDFLRRFLDHCAGGTNLATGARGTRLDYVGFHSKGSTRIVDGHVRMEIRGNLAMNREAFATIASFPAFRATPIIIGECDPEGAAALSSRANPANGYRNGCAYAAYEVAVMKHTIDLAERAGVNLRGVLTWAFLFDGKDAFEGFRTLSTNGIDKPVLNAFKLLGMLAGRRVPLASSGALGAGAIIEKSVRDAPDIDGLAAATDGGAQVLLWNYHDDLVPAPQARVRLRIRAPSGAARARISHWRIDGEHANAHARWLALGSPPRLSPAERSDLRAAAELALLEPIRFGHVRDGVLEVAFDLPRFAVSLVEARWWP